MEIITVLIVVSAVVITVQSEYYVNYDGQLARDFMHFGKRSPDMIQQFDGDNGSPKRGEFSRDFLNFGKRSVDDNWSDTMIRIDDTPESFWIKDN
ncbi:Actin cytoskeleton-regulatory complex protein [Dirofilaria immitis]